MKNSYQEELSSAKEWTRKHPFWSGIIVLIVIIILIPGGKDTPASIIDSVPVETQAMAEKPVSDQKVSANTVTVTPTIQKTPVITQTPTQPQSTETKTDREKMIEIFKANASSKWGTDYEMVNYTVKNQTAAYDWVVKQTQHPDIITRAKSKWQNDYEMIKYTYENQVAAYNWIMAQTTYPDIMARAKQKWGGDYEMVKYEYEKQVAAYNER